jgi:hypothetical protein
MLIFNNIILQEAARILVSDTAVIYHGLVENQMKERGCLVFAIRLNMHSASERAWVRAISLVWISPPIIACAIMRKF